MRQDARPTTRTEPRVGLLAALRRLACRGATVATLALAIIVAAASSTRDHARAVGPAPDAPPVADTLPDRPAFRLTLPVPPPPTRVAPTPVPSPPPAAPARAASPSPAIVHISSEAPPARGSDPLPKPAAAPPMPTSAPAVASPPPGTRDKRLWPFAADSIWNMPIGSGAVYVPAGILPASRLTVDDEYLVFPHPGDPLRPVFTNGIWGAGRCKPVTYRYSINVPDGFVVRDAAPPFTPNNVAAILDLDGRTLHQMNPVSRCESGGPLTAGWLAPDEDIYGPGILGGHGGSGMSSIGGSLRKGELTGPDPIRHALKVNLWGHRWLSPASGGHRWPAVAADSFFDDPDSPDRYNGPLPQLRMGALLAIPRDVDIDALGLRTPAARKIAWTMQNYGAYVVDDTTWDSHALDVEAGVADEFEAAYGYGIEAGAGPWYGDMMTVFGALAVVDNNGPSSIGGGGTPLQPLAPPIGN